MKRFTSSAERRRLTGGLAPLMIECISSNTSSASVAAGLAALGGRHGDTDLPNGTKRQPTSFSTAAWLSDGLAAPNGTIRRRRSMGIGAAGSGVPVAAARGCYTHRTADAVPVDILDTVEYIPWTDW